MLNLITYIGSLQIYYAFKGSQNSTMLKKSHSLPTLMKNIAYLHFSHLSMIANRNMNLAKLASWMKIWINLQCSQKHLLSKCLNTLSYLHLLFPVWHAVCVSVYVCCIILLQLYCYVCLVEAFVPVHVIATILCCAFDCIVCLLQFTTKPIINARCAQKGKNTPWKMPR